MQLNTVLNSIKQIAPGRCYLVGGSVRDLLLERISSDIDMVVTGSAGDTVYRLAELTGIKPVVLSAEHDIMRAVISGSCHLDITGLGERNLEDDLKRRDFTINAMALPLESYLQKNYRDIIDPLGGLNDLQQGRIKACSSQVFEEDPLRTLRAMRLKCQLGFSIENGTFKLMQNTRRPLSDVPGERTWEELCHIFYTPGSYAAFDLLSRETGILGQLFPEVDSMRETEQNYYHADNVWVHCLKTLYYFEQILQGDYLPADLNEKIPGYLYQLITNIRTRLPVIKLACLFHDVGKLYTWKRRSDGRITFYGHHTAGGPVAQEIGEKLKMSRQEQNLLRLLVEQHMQPLFLYKETPSDKAVIKFFRKLCEEVPGCLTLSLADVCSSRGSTGREDLARQYSKYISGLLARYFEEKEDIINPRLLLSGDEICSMFNLNPSPFIGRIKNTLQEAQAEGRVKNRQEAVDVVKELVGKVDWEK
ncbi:MAG: hypothetical protein K9L56_07070 [Clostridiales bacterium]|nr:hypothetical protein [Clostridiales bacterium]